MEKWMLPCLNKYFLGFDCPGCGLQRSIAFLLQGDLLAAAKIFPAVYSMILLMALLVLHLLDRSRNYQKAVIACAVLNATVIIISYFYKMTNLIF